MSHESHNDELNLPDRLSTALQAALREATPGDPAPSTELRAALAARFAALSSQPNSSAEVKPMSASSNSSWFRVAATLIASGCAAAIAIAILLPKNREPDLAQIASQFKKPKEVSATIVTGSSHKGIVVLNDGSRSMGDGEANQLANPKAAASHNEAFSFNPGEKAIEDFTYSGSRTSATEFNRSGGGKADGQPSRLPGIGFNPGQQVQGQPANGPVAASGSGGNPNNSSTPLSTLNGQATGSLLQPGREYKGAALGRGAASSASPTGGGIAISGPAPADPLKHYAIAPQATPAPTGAPHPTSLSRLAAAKPASESAPGAVPLPTIMNPEPRPNLAFGSTPEKRPIELRLKEGGEQEKLSRLQEYEWRDQPAAPHGEQYEQRVENIFQGVRAEPLSTFSIDVDTASYTNCRRFLDGRQLPPTAAVRVEEFINYFRYDYPQPTNKDPFSVNMEMADCPWTPNHKLLRVGLKGKEIDRRERPESNLVFLVDVSGSMSSEDKLPLLREALHRWVNELSANDRVTICTYAGDAGLRLPTTRGDQKDKLHAAIETLQSGGSTHGSAGIKLAYEQATANFLENGGVNRVLWATDGDLNVGTTNDDELVELITKQAKTGVFLTVLGVGTGNLKDAKLEKMADKGNGIYAYLDSIKEARKVLIEQMSGTTITIAKDVKIQIEFNPAEIAGYRLIGYENRILAAEDFANDKKDAGEIGAGHTVTALYEIIPVGAEEAKAAGPAGEPLKYQAATATAGSNAAEVKLSDAAKTGEMLTLKLRFKQPDGHKSELREFPLKDRGGKFTAASRDFQFAGCVAQFAMILRDSQYRGTMTTAAIAEIASATKGEDKDGSRQEFVELVKRVQELGK